MHVPLSSTQSVFGSLLAACWRGCSAPAIHSTKHGKALCTLGASGKNWLAQVYIRMDQPQTALQQYTQAAARQPGQIELLLGQARVHDALNDLEQGVKLYKQVHLSLSLAM